MDFSFSPEQEAIRDAVGKICARFPDEYWLQRDREGGVPDDFHGAMARDGWLGIAMPEQHGGAGLGITEAALMMQTISQSGAGFSGASAGHMNIFGLHPVVRFGTPSRLRSCVDTVRHRRRLELHRDHYSPTVTAAWAACCQPSLAALDLAGERAIHTRSSESSRSMSTGFAT